MHKHVSNPDLGWQTEYWLFVTTGKHWGVSAEVKGGKSYREEHIIVQMLCYLQVVGGLKKVSFKPGNALLRW